MNQHDQLMRITAIIRHERGMPNDPPRDPRHNIGAPAQELLKPNGSTLHAQRW